MSVCGYTDRFYYDKSWWRRWCWLQPGHAGDHFEEPRAEQDIFEAFRQWRNDTFGEIVAEDDAPPFTITTPGHEVQLADLKGGPAKILKWVLQNPAWVVKANVSETFHQPIFYAADSKTSLARKGEQKTPEAAKTHTSVQAVMVHRRKKVADFWATWITVDGKTSFVSASMWDQFTGERIVEPASTQFEDWLRLLAPVGASKPRAARARKEDKDQMDYITEGEWIAA